MRDMQDKKRLLGLLCVITIYVVMVGLYSFYVPAWENPDEPAHYLYVKHLATTGRPPGPNPVKRVGPYYLGGYVTSPYEWYHPALGYAWPAFMWRIIEAIKPGSLPVDFPEVALGHPDARGFDRGLFLSTRDKPLDLQPGDKGLILLRFGTALLGLPILIAVYLAGTWFYKGDDSLLVLLPSWVLTALIPQFLFIMGTVRNDSTNNMMSALSILILFYILQPHAEKPFLVALIAGLCLGLTMLTKSTASFLLPCALLAVSLSRFSLSVKVRMLIILGLCVLFLTGVYYLATPETREAFVYNSTHVKIKPEFINFRYILNLITPFAHMFWARFGWAGIEVPGYLIWLSSILCFSGILLTAVISTGWVKSIRISSDERKQSIFLMTVILANLSLIIYYNLFLTQPQGRFLFPSMLPFSLLVFWGLHKILGSIKTQLRIPLQWTLFIGVFIYLLVFNYISLFQAIIPASYVS
ncbi:MAG: hypothetical protein P1S60_13455 [Anaerolineae bacterium]|nr:hypothetical protein [Anaerolineae bacterium]